MKHRVLRKGVLSVAAISTLAAGQIRADEVDTIAEIVVTAQKRAQSSQDVPLTMQAYSADDLRSQGAVSAADLAKFTPGLNIAGANAGQTLLFGIRGVVQQDFIGSAESPVATYVDEGYIAAHSLMGVDLFDLDHVEVLKGPQGTLFGRNATGGVVNIFTKTPSATPDGYIEASYGSYNDTRIEGAFGGPITDTLRFRVAAMHQQNSAWVTNTSPTGDDLGGGSKAAARVRLEYAPNDTLNLLMTGYISEWRFSWGPYFSLSTRQVPDANGTIVNSVIVNQPTLLGTLPSDEQTLTLDANHGIDHGGSSSLRGGTAKISWNFGPTLTSITDVKHSKDSEFVDDDGSPASWLDSNNTSFANSFSEELRLYGEHTGLRWFTGAYYLQIYSGMHPDRNWIYDPGVVIDDTFDLHTHSYSVFGQVEYDLTRQVSLTAGLRGTKEKKDYHYASDAMSLDYVLLGPARTPYAGNSDNNLVTAKLEADYKPAPGMLLYASWNRGAKAGSFNAPFAGGTSYPDSAIPYRPETLNAYELGEKSTFLDERLRLNSSVFYYDYKNYQAFNFIGLSTEVSNLPAKVYGAEIDLLAKPVRQLTTQVTTSYTHNRVSDVTGVAPTPVDRVAPYTSEWKATALARYGVSAGSGELALQADAQYTGPQWFSLSNYDATHMPGYTLVNARLSWTNPQWQLEVFGSNLTNKRYDTVGFDISGLCGCTQIGYGRPTWWGASVRRNF
jgi:iron complex outermembrane receptor protein